MMRRLTLAVSVGIFLGSMEGCSFGNGNVHGQVKYQGKTVVHGSVVMVGDNQMPIVGSIEPDGAYSIKGVPAGTVRVGVLSPDPAASSNALRRTPLHRGGARSLKAKIQSTTARNDLQGPPGNTSRAKWFPLPKQYEDPDTSGIVAEIRRGDNTFDIELK
jgi:hypothetical protein